MKIALFIISFNGGGVVRVMLNLAEGLVRRGIAVDLLVLRRSGPLQSQVPQGVRMIHLASASTLAALVPLMRYLAREKPDALLSATSRINCVAVWAWLLSGRRGQLVVTEHTTPSHFLPAQKGFAARLLPRLMRWSYPRASSVVAVCHSVAEDVAACTGMETSRIRVIHNAVVSEALHAKCAEPLYHDWFQPGSVPVIVAVGRLSAEKDFVALIRAFARVRAQCEARLLILGEGVERPALQAEIDRLDLGQHARLAGFVDNPYPYMREAAVFVLSSRMEGLPTVLIEALACGAPVVATDCPHGPAEILGGGQWGRLVPVGDVQALAVAMRAALLAPRNDSGRARAADFSCGAAVEQYLQLLGVIL